MIVIINQPEDNVLISYMNRRKPELSIGVPFSTKSTVSQGYCSTDRLLTTQVMGTSRHKIEDEYLYNVYYGRVETVFFLMINNLFPVFLLTAQSMVKRPFIFRE
jgi:hypothetical protein